MDADDQSQRNQLEVELAREVATEHPLAGTIVTAVAACCHCDDVIFALADGRFSTVHLSYPKDGPDRPPWPRSNVFEDWLAVKQYVEHHATSE